MDFTVPEDLELIGRLAREIASKFPPEYWREKEEKHEFAEEFWRAISEAGFTGVVIPEEYGGSGMGVQALLTVMENLSAHGCGLAGTWYLTLSEVFVALPVTRYGTLEQKEKYLPKLASGEYEGAMALTEPAAGSNTFRISTTAVKEGDEYVINGSKIFISGIDRAKVMVLIARTTPLDKAPKKTYGLTLFLVDLPNKAVKVEPIAKHGINYSNTCEVRIEGLRVPEENILGPENYGWYVLLDILNPERMAFSIGAIGTAELAIRTAVEYSKTRDVFGVPIGAYQALQHPLAEAYSALQAAKLLTYKAAWLYDTHHKPPEQERVRDPKTIMERSYAYREVGSVANMAKIVAVENAIKATYWAMQVFGGYGYARETHVERWWREVNLLRLAPVTQQLALNYVAHHVLGMPRL